MSRCICICHHNRKIIGVCFAGQRPLATARDRGDEARLRQPTLAPLENALFL